MIWSVEKPVFKLILKVRINSTAPQNAQGGEAAWVVAARQRDSDYSEKIRQVPFNQQNSTFYSDSFLLLIEIGFERFARCLSTQ